jgi:hypothetical protein
MLNNYDLKPATLDEVIDVFTEFSDINDGEFSSKEIFLAANNLIEIARGKVSKDKINDRQGYPSYYAQDTYIVMTRKPWKTYCEDYDANQLSDPCCNDWNQGFNKFNEINMGCN